MLSLSHENQYYQVTLLSHEYVISSKTDSSMQVFLTNGLCLGLATGITYVPSTLRSNFLKAVKPTYRHAVLLGIGIVSHYFQRRRALAMGFVSSGSALGLFYFHSF